MAEFNVSRRAFAALLGGGLVVPCLAGASLPGVGAPTPVIPPGPYVPPDTLAAVRDLYSRMTVPVTVNGQGPYPFVVDTGANRTVISGELAATLGLPPGDPLPVNGVAGVQMTPTTRAQLGLGGRVAVDAPLLVMREDGIGGPGLLGLDDLDGQAVTLDFRRQEVRIEPGRRLAGDRHAIVLKAYRRDGQLLLVDADLDDHTVIAFLDTGSDNTIGNLALASRASAPNEINRTQLDASILSATGQTIDGAIHEVQKLRLGSLTIARWSMTFADLHTFRLWRLTSRPAMLLGVDVLSRFDYVCLDFARNEVRFRLPG